MLPISLTDTWNLSFAAGRKMVPVTIKKEGDRLFLKFGFNRTLLETVKTFAGARWHGGKDEPNPRKEWSILDIPRNRFQIANLAFPSVKDPKNPYFKYEQAVGNYEPTRKLYAHQLKHFREAMTYHYYVIGAEPGLGKTLCAIEIMEASGHKDWIYVGPKSAIISVKLEFELWKAKVKPMFLTYEGMRSLAENWPGGKVPHGIVFDEAQRIKNPTAKRSQAAMHFANAIREEHGDKGFVILMSGTPAPRSPADWWHVCEVTCPGFLREGTLEKFKRRLAVIEQRENIDSGGAYPHLVTWRDSEEKCQDCGRDVADSIHASTSGVDVFGNRTEETHKFVPGINEVSHLAKRMKGLVSVTLKKDGLPDLPDRIYKEHILKASRSTLNAMKLIQAKAPNTITALTLMRELSDGFQYIEAETGTEVCPTCKGAKTEHITVDENDPSHFPSDLEISCGFRFDYDEEGRQCRGRNIKIVQRTEACRYCSGTGIVTTRVREARMVDTPKESALIDLLDEYDDRGRIVIYAGFTGSIDRVIQIIQKQSWEFIRVDGRGWTSSVGKDPLELVKRFQSGQNDVTRLAFVGQPGAGGVGLTLTASDTIVYYSNDFNYESREQSENRIHRISMDVKRGATIRDLLHLPCDKVVLDNLKGKRKLSLMSMGQLNLEIKQIEAQFSEN